MFGTSLRVLTARGLPAQLAVAVMLFLASPGAKRLMNEHWHRVTMPGWAALCCLTARVTWKSATAAAERYRRDGHGGERHERAVLVVRAQRG
jgi:hypothetical protein